MVGYRSQETESETDFSWVTTDKTSQLLQGLTPGTTYEVVVESVFPTGQRARSDAVSFRTAATGYASGAVRYTVMTRVSEFTDDVDFLDNHDSATSGALAVLLARMAKQVNVSESCLSALAAAGCARAQGEPCLTCVRNLPSAPPSCGNATWADYNSHFFCGEGWPSFSMFSTPMAEYCVENQAAPVPATPTHAAGWAEYVSCDAPEAGESNHPTDPVCVCWVSWDRAVVSHEPAHVYAKYCNVTSSGHHHGAHPCTCDDANETGSIFLRDGSTSARFVGKSAVYLPYTFYTTPRESWPATDNSSVGDNFSTPKNGSCAEGAKLGDAGCTWKRLPRARIMYYGDLLEAGWDASLPHDTPESSSGSLHNIASMKDSWGRVGAQYFSPRCCGC